MLINQDKILKCTLPIFKATCTNIRVLTILWLECNNITTNKAQQFFSFKKQFDILGLHVMIRSIQNVINRMGNNVEVRGGVRCVFFQGSTIKVHAIEQTRLGLGFTGQKWVKRKNGIVGQKEFEKKKLRSLLGLIWSIPGKWKLLKWGMGLMHVSSEEIHQLKGWCMHGRNEKWFAQKHRGNSHVSLDNLI